MESNVFLQLGVRNTILDFCTFSLDASVARSWCFSAMSDEGARGVILHCLRPALRMSHLGFGEDEGTNMLKTRRYRDIKTKC